MTTKSKLAMFMAMAYLSSDNNLYGENENKLTKQKIDKINQENRRKSLEVKRSKRGIKKFEYGDNVIYARNKQNADRKARNKGYLKS